MIGQIILFSLAVGFSTLWLGVSYKYVELNLGWETLFSMDPLNLAILIGSVVAPVVLLWLIISFVAYFISLGKQGKSLVLLLGQSKKNAEQTEVLVRTMINIQNQSKNSTMLKNLNFHINDINEILSEICLQFNLISQDSIAPLWERINNGNIWAFCRVLINNYNQGQDFCSKLHEACQKNDNLKALILDFSYRYKQLCLLLSDYDKQRVIADIIEEGALGKTDAIIKEAVYKFDDDKQESFEYVWDKKQGKDSQNFVENKTQENEKKKFSFFKKTKKQEPKMQTPKNIKDDKEPFFEPVINPAVENIISQTNEEEQENSISQTEQKEHVEQYQKVEDFLDNSNKEQNQEVEQEQEKEPLKVEKTVIDYASIYGQKDQKDQEDQEDKQKQTQKAQVEEKETKEKEQEKPKEEKKEIKGTELSSNEDVSISPNYDDYSSIMEENTSLPFGNWNKNQDDFSSPFKK